MNPITDNYKYEMKHWWLPLVVGVLYVLFAIFLMFTPHYKLYCIEYTF